MKNYINQKAYALLFTVGADQALPLFELNTRHFPQSANSWDSLAEVWMANGDKKKAILYYEKALSINPNLQSAIQQLENLK